MPNIPKFSVTIPVYNCDKYIGLAIESVLGQTCPDFELLIVNNASTDRTAEIIAKYTRDCRVNVVVQERFVSATQNWNTCLEHARGEWMCILGADDVLFPEFLSRMSDWMALDQRIELITSAVRIIDATGKPAGEWSSGMHGVYRPDELVAHQIRRNLINITSCVFKRSVIGDSRFSVRYPILLDYEFFTKLMVNLKLICIQEEPIANYRVHAASGTTALRGKIQWFIDERCLKTEFLIAARKRRWVSMVGFIVGYSKLKMALFSKAGIRLLQLRLPEAKACLKAGFLRA